MSPLAWMRGALGAGLWAQGVCPMGPEPTGSFYGGSVPWALAVALFISWRVHVFQLMGAI